jgi:hypothetical protein
VPLAKVLVPLVGAGASGQGTSQDCRGYPSLELSLRVSALDAGASVQAQVEHSEDALDWEPLGSPIQRTELGKVRARLPGAYRYVRLTYAVTGGVASLTFAGKALQVYAQPTDLHRLGIEGEGLKRLSLEEQDKGLAAGSDFGRGIMTADGKVTVPLLGWDDDLRRAVCMVTAYDLRSGGAGGYQPTKKEEDHLRLRYDDAIRWFEGVRDGDIALVNPDDPDATNTTTSVALPEIYSDEPWGF